MTQKVHFAVKAGVPLDEKLVDLVAFLENNVGDLFAIGTLVQQDVEGKIRYK